MACVCARSVEKRCYLVRITTQTDLVTFNASESMWNVRCTVGTWRSSMEVLACYVVFERCLCVRVVGWSAVLSLYAWAKGGYDGVGHRSTKTHQSYMRVCEAPAWKHQIHSVHISIRTHTHTQTSIYEENWHTHTHSKHSHMDALARVCWPVGCSRGAGARVFLCIVPVLQLKNQKLFQWQSHF